MKTAIRIKTRLLKKGGTYHLKTGNDGEIRLTHPVEKTRRISNLAELIEEFRDTDGEIRMLGSDNSRFVWSEDTRHGQKGWRASRYINGVWDEYYLFVTDFEEALEICTDTTEENLARGHHLF